MESNWTAHYRHGKRPLLGAEAPLEFKLRHDPIFIPARDGREKRELASAPQQPLAVPPALGRRRTVAKFDECELGVIDTWVPGWEPMPGLP